VSATRPGLRDDLGGSTRDRCAGRQAVLAPGDISEEAHCRSLIERTVSELGTLAILVNSAAFQMTREGIEQIQDGEWDHTFRTNIFAVVRQQPLGDGAYSLALDAGVGNR
jgi:NAD(P)-dependent dehydrogenase (short-subunit alcohol dehydrogenase family)